MMKPWRSAFNPFEAEEFQALEKQAADLDAQRRVVTKALNLIRNRAVKRVTYAANIAEKKAATKFIPGMWIGGSDG